MTRGHAESAIKTTNGKVSLALTADNMIMCLVLVCLAEVVQLMHKPVVTLRHTLTVAIQENKYSPSNTKYLLIGHMSAAK